MKKASMILDRDFAIGRIDPRLYGSFIEHLGRAVYGGIYEPGHPTADENGFRRDVIDMVRKLGVPDRALSGRQLRFRLQLGRQRRPARTSAPAGSTSPGSPRRRTKSACTSSSHWAEEGRFRRSCTPSTSARAVPDAARNVVEYANHPAGSYWSDLRRQQRRGRRPSISSSGAWATRWTAPGRWAHKTAYEYGRARQRGREDDEVGRPVHRAGRLRQFFASRCPRSAPGNTTMLDECYDQRRLRFPAPLLRQSHATTRRISSPAIWTWTVFIKTVVSICDAVGGKKHSKKKLNLSFDEWNVWYHSHAQDNEDLEAG